MIFDKNKALLKAKKEHGFKYMYYYNRCTKETVHAKCPYHGDFQVPMFPHVFKRVGCPHCRQGTGLEYSDFKKHFDKLNVKIFKPVKPARWSPFGYMDIKCKHHGKVQVRPFNILNGKGCPDCARGIRSKDQFIKEANKVHKKWFDYSLLKDGNVFGDILVRCPLHGTLRMNSQAHLGGTGCRSCTYKEEKHFYIYLFFITNGKRGFYKLGLAKDVGKREQQLRRGLKEGYRIKLLKALKYRDMYGAFKAEYFFLSSFPGKPITDKTLVKDGSQETRVNGMSVNKALNYFGALDRRYRRIWKDYVPKRQVWVSEHLASKKGKKKKRARFNFKNKQ